MFEETNRKKRWYDWLGLVPSRIIRILLVLSVFPLCLAIFLGIYAYRANQFNLDEIAQRPDNCLAYDIHGKLIGSLSSEARLHVTRDQLPENLVNAFIAREDEDFFNHSGIVYTSMFRSLWHNLVTMSYAQGGSTITMQLARNCYELKDKTIDRKILEMALARRIEQHYNKDTILTAYLNRIYFGQQCYGIAQAAKKYFGKRVSELTLPECATLAGLVRGPSIFNPITDKTASIRERNNTLDRMEECGFISPEECESAKEATMDLHSTDRNLILSYPIMRLGREMDTLHQNQEEETSGLILMTTFDLAEQRELERTCERILLQLEASPAWKNMPKRIQSYSTNCLQAAVLCVESSSGRIIAEIGGRSPLDKIDRWSIPRKVGLLFLPLVNLGAADKNKNVIRNSPLATGRVVGYRRTKELAVMAGFTDPMPDSDALYLGMFDAPLDTCIATILSIQQKGQNIHLHSITQVASSRQSLIFSRDNIKKEREEILPTEAAQVVSSLPPFSVNIKGKFTTLSTPLPDGDGFFFARIGKQFSVFIWLGFDRDGAELMNRKGISNTLKNLGEHLSATIYQSMQKRAKIKKKQATERPVSSAYSLDQAS